MIKINITRNKDNITSLLVTGHADYADKGLDIVCSAVSALTQTLIANVDRLHPGLTHISDGRASVDLAEVNNEDIYLLMDAFVLGLKQIASQYPKNILLKEKVL